MIPISRLLLTPPTDDNPITQFFPVEEQPQPEPPFPEVPSIELSRRIREVIAMTITADNQEDETSDGTESSTGAYERYRTPEDLKATARVFYDASGE